jgi:hypothetical protein
MGGEAVSFRDLPLFILESKKNRLIKRMLSWKNSSVNKIMIHKQGERI